MGWVFLSALANRWLWLFAVFAGAVLVATGQVPLWFAALSAGAVLATGAAVDTAQRYRKVRHSSIASDRPPELALVRDQLAATYLARAGTAVARLEQARTSLGEAAADLSGDVDAKARDMLDALGHTGGQVDRLSEMLGGFDEPTVRAELADVEQALADDTSTEPGVSGGAPSDPRRSARPAREHRAPRAAARPHAGADAGDRRWNRRAGRSGWRDRRSLRVGRQDRHDNRGPSVGDSRSGQPARGFTGSRTQRARCALWY